MHGFTSLIVFSLYRRDVTKSPPGFGVGLIFNRYWGCGSSRNSSVSMSFLDCSTSFSSFCADPNLGFGAENNSAANLMTFLDLSRHFLIQSFLFLLLKFRAWGAWLIPQICIFRLSKYCLIKAFFRLE